MISRAFALFFCLHGVAWTAEPLTIQMVRAPAARTHQIMASHTFAQSINVVNGPGNARDYVAIFRVSDGLRVNWKYIDNTKDTVAKKAATSGPTAGTVTFTGLLPGNYFARFYVNGSVAQADMKWSEMFVVPKRELELILRESDTVIKNDRTLGVTRDIITVTHGDGREHVIEVEKDVAVNVRKAKDVQ